MNREKVYALVGITHIKGEPTGLNTILFNIYANEERALKDLVSIATRNIEDAELLWVLDDKTPLSKAKLDKPIRLFWKTQGNYDQYIEMYVVEKKVMGVVSNVE